MMSPLSPLIKAIKTTDSTLIADTRHAAYWSRCVVRVPDYQSSMPLCVMLPWIKSLEASLLWYVTLFAGSRELSVGRLLGTTPTDAKMSFVASEHPLIFLQKGSDIRFLSMLGPINTRVVLRLYRGLLDSLKSVVLVFCSFQFIIICRR